MVAAQPAVYAQRKDENGVLASGKEVRHGFDVTEEAEMDESRILFGTLTSRGRGH